MLVIKAAHNGEGKEIDANNLSTRLRQNFNHFPDNTKRGTISRLQNHKVIEQFIENLSPEDVPVKNVFELGDRGSISL